MGTRAEMKEYKFVCARICGAKYVIGLSDEDYESRVAPYKNIPFTSLECERCGGFLNRDFVLMEIEHET